MPRQAPILDVVIPCYNEERILRETYVRVTKSLGELAGSGRIRDWRLILVDNASRDRTLDIMRELFATERRITVVALRTNFGRQGSLAAGLAASTEDAAVTIAADLQEPPEVIGQMVDEYLKGHDLVLGVRTDRSKSDPLSWRVLAWMYYALAGALRTPTVPQHGELRLMARPIVEIVNSLPERSRFLRTLLPQIESRYATVPYSRAPQIKGRKHPLREIFAVALDGIVGFGFQPLRLILAGGLWLLAGSAIVAAALFFTKDSVSVGFGIGLVAVATIAVNMILLGIVGEYVGRVFFETRGRPIYLVRETLRHRADEASGRSS